MKTTEMSEKVLRYVTLLEMTDKAWEDLSAEEQGQAAKALHEMVVEERPA